MLTAVINHHDALRLRITERAGTWEQTVADPLESAELATESLPAGMPHGQHAGARSGSRLAQRADQPTGSPQPTADAPPTSKGSRARRATSRSACTASSATTPRETSCSPTSSPRSGNSWRAKRLRCNRSPRRGPSGPSVAPHSQPIPRSLKAVISGCRPPRRPAHASARKSPNHQEWATWRKCRRRYLPRKPPRSTTRGAGFVCRSRISCWPR